VFQLTLLLGLHLLESHRVRYSADGSYPHLEMTAGPTSLMGFTLLSV